MIKLNEDNINVIAKKHKSRRKFMYIFPFIMSITLVIFLIAFTISILSTYHSNLKAHNEVMEEYGYLLDDPYFSALYGDDPPLFPAKQLLIVSLMFGLPLLICIIWLLLVFAKERITPEITIAQDANYNYYIWNSKIKNYVYVLKESIIEVKSNYEHKTLNYAYRKPNTIIYENRKVLVENSKVSYTTVYYKKGNKNLKLKVEVNKPIFNL